MAKIRKSLIGALMCLILLLVGVCALAACGSKDLTVTFSIEGNEQTVDVIDGKVAFPNDPAKDYYEFRGWYTTETFEDGTEFTSDTKISNNIKVYAYFAPIYVNISLNGGVAEEIKLADLSAKTSEYTADALERQLTFDGWYIDADFSTEYKTQDVDNLYARYVAEVVFDNGYEIVYTEKVQVNTPVSKPDPQEIVKYYMDSEDIFYVDEAGNDVDFSKPVTANATVTVLWKTPNLEFAVNSSTGNLYFKDFKEGTVIGTNATMGNYPILSFPGKATHNGKLMTVESVVLSSALENIAYACRKIIVNEGIKQIGGLSCGLNGLVTEIQLPSTLKIIENSFNNFSELDGNKLFIPDGTEIILNSFWKLNLTSVSAYDFEIAVPDSVVNLSQVPTNLTFSQNSAFSKIDGAIYQKANGNDKEILIAKYDATDGMLTVDEGVKLIQAGAFTSSVLKDVDYISLPSTWQGIHYNANAVEYEYYISGRKGNLLYSDEQSIANAGKMIIDNLQDLERVLVYTSAYPADASAEYISGTVDNKTKPYTDSAFADNNKVVFVGEIAEGQSVTVNVRATHRVSGEYVIQTAADVLSNSTEITEQLVLSAVNLYQNNNYVIKSVTQFGEDYTVQYGSKVTCNQYIDIVYEDRASGFTAQLNEDGTAYVITGFDESTAMLDDNNLYKVTIPAEFNGKPVEEISEGAFKNNTDISTVIIPLSVKTIGAEAFMNTVNLKTVDIASGGLEVIGRSAFENSAIEEIAVPLAKMKDIQPYAFKTRTLKRFLVASGETVDASGLGMSDGDLARLFAGGKAPVVPAIGSYVFMADPQGNYYQIIKYVGTQTVAVKKGTSTDETMDLTVNDVQLVAVAGGTTNGQLVLGYSMRIWGSYGGMYSECLSWPVMRYEIMEGSVYYLDNVATHSSTWGIIFGIISKVHKNAFTDMNDKFTQITESSNGTKTVISYIREIEQEAICDTWTKMEDFADTSIFEDGWWEGVMKSDPDYDTKMEWIQYLKKTTSASLSG